MTETRATKAAATKRKKLATRGKSGQGKKTGTVRKPAGKKQKT